MQVAEKVKRIAVISLFSVCFLTVCAAYAVPSYTIRKYDYIEFCYNGSVKKINLGDYKIKVEYSAGISKNVADGFAVTEKGEKAEIVFYSDINTFKFKDGFVKYRICSDKIIAYLP